MRYVIVPAPFLPVNPIDDDPVPVQKGQPQETTFARSCRLALLSIAAKGTCDMAILHDLKTKTDRAVAGEILELTDAEYEILKPEFVRPNPQLVGAAWMFSGRDHQRAVTEAVSKDPRG